MLTDEQIDLIVLNHAPPIHPDCQQDDDHHALCRAIEAAVLEAQKQEPVAWDDERADEIVSGLYRKFKEWSLRNFTADDVTWCEVKAEINRLISTHLHPAPAPEGMVLVPRKMTVAVGCAWKDATDAGATLQEMWDAMIAAAEKEAGK